MSEPRLMDISKNTSTSVGINGFGSPNKPLSKTIKSFINQILSIDENAGISIANKLSGDSKAFGVKDSQAKVTIGKRLPKGTKIRLTIDHLYDSKGTTKTNENILKRITSKGAHVTLFIGCRDPQNQCKKELSDANKLQKINPALIHIRAHTSPPSKNLQDRNSVMGTLTQGIQKIEPETKGKNMSASRHGNGKSWKGKAVETNGLDQTRVRKTEGGPVISNGASMSEAMKVAQKYSKEGAVFWTHAHEIKKNNNQDKVLEEFLMGVQNGRYQSLPY